MSHDSHREVASMSEEHTTMITSLRPFRIGEDAINESVDAHQAAHVQSGQTCSEESLIQGTFLFPQSADLLLGSHHEIDSVDEPRLLLQLRRGYDRERQACQCDRGLFQSKRIVAPCSRFS